MSMRASELQYRYLVLTDIVKDGDEIRREGTPESWDTISNNKWPSLRGCKKSTLADYIIRRPLKPTRPLAPKLLPCPCCNSQPVERPYMVDIDDWGNKSESGVVFCTNCGIHVETGCGQEAAVERWNRRDGMPEHPQRSIEFVGRGHVPIENAVAPPAGDD